GASNRSCARLPRCGLRISSTASFTTFRGWRDADGSSPGGRCRLVASQRLTTIRRMRLRRAVGYLRAAMFVALTAGAVSSALAGLAPDPATTHEAVVQVYGAR